MREDVNPVDRGPGWRGPGWRGAVTVAALSAAGVAAYVRLPAGGMLPVHFGAGGVPNAFAPAAQALAAAPLTAAFIWGVCEFVVRRVPGSGKAMGAFWAAMAGLMALAQALIAGWGLGWRPDAGAPMLAGVGALLVVVGNVLPTLSRNGLAGIRVPWTLADDASWTATHRQAAPLWMAAGAFLVVAAFVPALHSAALPAALGVALVGSLVIAWRNRPVSR